MASPERLNVLLLFTDQQRFDTIAAGGYGHMLTPNLDRLVHEGRYYPNAHTPNPVCMAARHYLLTGLPGRYHNYFGNRNGPIADYSLPTIPRLLSEAGYVTAGVGKMHHHPPRMHHGYDELHLMEELPSFREEDAYAVWLETQGYGEVRHLHGCRHLLYHRPQRAVVPERMHGSAFIADRTIEVIDRHRQRPFYVMSSWVKPHPPWNIPLGWEGLYADRELPTPTARCREYPFCNNPSNWFGDLDAPEVNRRMREAYFTSITLIDKHLGRILDHLDSTGLAERTLVMFASDHGEMLGDRGFFQKGLPYDGSVRVPMIIRCPGRVDAGQVCEDFADLWDIFPTAVDAAGLGLPDLPYPGESLLSASPRRDRGIIWSDYASGPNRWCLARDRQYKFVHWFNQGHEELYDTVADPAEQHNLLTNGGAPDAVYDRLRSQLLTWEAERGPQGNVVNGDFNDLDAKPFADDAMGKYPLWAHHQFPTWGPLAKEHEAALMADEILAATDGVFDDLLDDERWRERWCQGWRDLGGSDELAHRIFGE